MFFGLERLFFLISFVKNTHAFAKPLTAAEEAEYVRKMAEGDMGAADTLIEHNMRLVAHIARKYACAGADSDDMISIGSIGLIKGVRSYRPDKGIRLSAYISRCIENEILMAIRASKKLQRETSIEEPLGLDREGNHITFGDILSRDGDEIVEQVGSEIELEKLLRQITSCLEERERQIILLRYGIGGTKEYTQNEVAHKLGISRSYVSRLEKKAIGKLREGMRSTEK